jgi:uncharacterized protein (TIGR04222 family)
MRARVAAVVLAAVMAIGLLFLGPAGAQELEDWVINDYTVTMQVTDTADLLVVENIRLDFGFLQRRGIFRHIPLWEDLQNPLPADSAITLPAGASPSDYHRVWKIDAVEVESPSGAPTNLNFEGPSSDTNGNVVIRIGNPDITITGAQEYTIRYRIRGALNPFDDFDELLWDAIGTDWGVPIERASVTVIAPGIQEAVCFQGSYFSTETCDARTGADRATFTARPLSPYEGVTVGVRLDKGAVAVPAPLVDQKPSLARAFVGRGWSLPLSAGLAIAGIGGIVTLAFREGRDRVARGPVTAAGLMDSTRPEERRRGLLESPPVPVQFRPPDDLRPAQLGLIVDERVDNVDVSATLVDLAVRGHLRIDELEKGGWFRKQDWKLVRLPAPDDPLEDYERLLLDALFSGRVEVTISDLKGTFASDYKKVESAIYTDGQSRGWFARRPDHARGIWVGVGLGLAALGVGLVILLSATDSRVALVGVPVVVCGLLLAALNRRMPRRTAKGSDLMVRTLGFREFITRAETGRMEFAEAQHLFVSYLPFAVVFGAVDKWAQAFAQIGIDVAAAVGGFYTSRGGFDLMNLSSGMNEFSSAVGPAMSQAPASSSGSGGSFGGGGGSSGGGGGGGGGGSW